MNNFIDFYVLFVAIVSIFFLTLALTNTFWLRICSKKTSIFSGKKVSVCIPARNEEKNIERCVRSFMNQTYSNYEVIVLDDNSDDKTASILECLKKEFPQKLKVIKGKSLPAGWTGKVYALNQLVHESTGEYLLFTDADTVHSDDSVAFAVTNIEKHNVDLLSGYIGQYTVTFGEKITIPVMYILSGFIIPLFLNRISKTPITSVAIGQYIMIKKDVLLACGGYESLKKYVTEDIYLARLVKSKGFKTLFLNCRSVAICRMYTNYSDCVCGIEKNIFSFVCNKNGILFLAVFGLVVFLILPIPLFMASMFYDLIYGIGISNYTLYLGINIISMFFVWVLISVSQKLSAITPFLYPLIFCNLVYLALISYSNTARGTGYLWKGRIVH
ncbi:MAG: glycosyltransferase [Spirochaetaceae bacterium]|nr:glycosyltransferase [Spirochaetaceae bacterium]